jgi:Spy/CpxP family protein refolding chaperone
MNRSLFIQKFIKMQRLYSQLLLGVSIAIFQSVNAIAYPIKIEIANKPCDRTVKLNNIKQITKDTASNLFQQLNLSHQQKQKIKQISQQYQAQIIQLKENLQLAQQQLATMMAGTDSVAVIRAKHEEIAQFRQQLAALHFESMLATREILTPQQRQKFAEIIEARQ